ncbi:hypothetical protein NQ317_012377 [Molorchus minor]|uniref:Uncharacterized protein n=1 Tax=Molorchus minor TaxID=1323400 RepID=A0ABQ9JS36_9CUCU|nr:hypothetical protein NQ317_012377 [Molorchus minor]
MCRNTDLARGRYKCTESIYVLHIPVLYTEHFVKLVRKAYIDRFERHISTARGRYKCTESIYVLHIPVLYTEHFVKLVRKAYIDRFERHISTGRMSSITATTFPKSPNE